MKKNKSFLLILSIFSLLSSCTNPSINKNSKTETFNSNITSESSKSESINSSNTKDSNGSFTSNESNKESINSNSQNSDEIVIEKEWISLDFTTFGNTFRKQLQSLIISTGTKTISYKTNNDVLSESDGAINGYSGVIPFYHADNENTTKWNKEHVWPNSRGAGKTGPGSDPQMLRPTNESENSSRSNYFYGNGTSDEKNTWDPASFGYEPARGEAARIIFYCATRYYNTCGTGGSSKGFKPLELSNNPNDATTEHTMGRLDRLLEWNEKYPVTNQEKRRNEYLYKNHFAKNPFIDHPEFANYIWDKNGIRTTTYTI